MKSKNAYECDALGDRNDDDDYDDDDDDDDNDDDDDDDDDNNNSNNNDIQMLFCILTAVLFIRDKFVCECVTSLSVKKCQFSFMSVCLSVTKATHGY